MQDQTQKIKNLIKLGVSEEKITELLNNGATLDQIEDFCNDEINKKLEEIMSDILSIISNEMQAYKWFTLIEEEIKNNENIRVNIYKRITQLLLEKDILMKNIDLIFNTVSDTVRTVLTRAQDSYKDQKEQVLALMLGKELSFDIKLSDIDNKLKELKK